ncbi:non-ribosomal peptide synthetase [Actinokineospora terrae]|uniref:Phenyloxazoline synthase MbtB n=1 Tax=Actinokineospora terrae TaxID=155974 RepID=A0A1H9LMB7_9PSEU|nr:non-ribosomal peptide synthetase [Actinokineospora terrae]SER12275.1 amino acid adenylation domain-containing protein [Actinokineospora terrae]
MDDHVSDLRNVADSPAAAPRSDLPRAEPRPDQRHRPFPLTDIQYAYLIGRNRGLELGGVSSHFSFEFDSQGLDLARLTEALNKVIAQHDMLRAVVDTGGEQRVLEQVPHYAIPCTDLRAEPPAARSAAVAAIRAELADQVLPVDRWPLFDIRATRLTERGFRLHVSMDLLFVDARGFFQMLRQWRELYDNPTAEPRPLDLSFRDYVLAEQELATTTAGRWAEKYWLSRLDEIPAAPELPLATAPERIGRPAFGRRATVITRPRWAAMTAAAESRGITPSALLLAAYCEVLRTWSKRQEFTVALSRLDRHPLHPDVDHLLGDFLSPSLFAVRAGEGTTFHERAAAVQRRLRDDQANAAFGGIRVLRELTRRQGDGRAASMPVVFSDMLGCGAEALSGFGEVVHSASQTPQIWLENQVVDQGGGVAVTWNSVTGLFAPGVLDAMFHAYRTLLDRLVDDAAAWDSTAAVVPLPAAQADERARANATDTDIPPALLHDLVADAARRTPDAVAVIADGAEVTYRHLTEPAHRLARRLRECCGAEPNTVIAVSMRPGPDLVSALLGVLHSGAAYVSIDPDLPEQRRLALLERCRVLAVVTEPDLRDRLAWPEGVELVTLGDEATLRHSADPVGSRQDHDDLAYVIFTSGSTGEPKGVMISHRSAGNTVQDINRRFGVSRDDRVLALAPTGFDLSVYDIFGVLGAGGAVVVPAPERASDLTHWSELIDRHGVTIWNSVPAPMRIWVESLGDTTPASRLRLALLSGDWIPTTLPEQVHRHFPELNLVSLGGATEGSIWSVFNPIGVVPPEWPSIPYGKPLANQRLHVLDKRFEPCPTWVAGEIHIGGVGVADGYWADPVRTAERFVLHPGTGERLYRTGDLGRYLPGGDIEILGRDDFQVKINGYRVELGEVEAALSRHPGVRQALVAAPTHPHSKQRQLAAYLVVDGSESTDPAVLRAALAEQLPSYMVPNHFVTIAALPLTPNGKIDHKALPAPWQDSPSPDERVQPRSDVERDLLEIWSRQLGHNDFGAEDGFFDVGGDSLHAVGIIGHLRTAFNISSAAEQEVIEALFTNATITDFAAVIGSLRDTAS